MDNDTALKVISRYESMTVLSVYSILFTNDIVCGQVIEGIQAMKRTRHYRHLFRHYLTLAERERSRYERTVNGVIGDRVGFFADMNDRFTDEVCNHVEMLYLRFKQELDDRGVADSAGLARFEVARSLCDYACIQFDVRMDDLIRHDARFKGFSLEYLRLDRVRRMMNMASDNLHIGKTVDMNTESCKSAFDVLVRKLSDYENIVKAISVA